MRWVYLRFLLFFTLLLGFRATAIGQDRPSLYVNPALWSKVEAGLRQEPSPTSYAFIPELVAGHFGQQPDSLYRNYHAVMVRLERRLFNLEAAIYVGKELAKLAAGQKNLRGEADAYANLSRYHDALGTYQLAAVNTEKAIAIYKKLGDRQAILSAEYHRLALRLHFVSREEVLPLMDSLLVEAEAQRAGHLVNDLHLRLIEQNLLARNYGEAERHMAYLEKLPVSDPIAPQEYPFLINVAKGRADLALIERDYPEAERYLKKTLRYCRAEPGLWFEIYTLLALTELEMMRENLVKAKSYLETARAKAEALQLHDLLVQTYALKTKVAEQENRPGDALLFLKRKILHEEKFNARSEGFTIENFYLQAERDRLTADKKNRELELNLKNSQLTYSLVILLLVVLLAVGLVMGYFRQRRVKLELARKNSLIQQHATQLESLDAAKNRFFANISHELRTPLSLIVGPVTTLLRGNQFTEKHTVLLKAVRRSAGQLEAMVKNILDLQKLEAAKVPLHEEPTELDTFFQLHLGQFESLAQWKRIRYAHEVRIAPALVAQLDREKCRQVLYNLLSNAFKFTPTAGKVEVAVGVQDDRLFFRVADSGPGIPADDLPRIFDRFFQTSQKSQPSVGGTGIGLSICREYVQLMNGEIRAESKPGEGSAFYVSLPLTLSEQPSSALAPVQAPETDATYEVAVPTAVLAAANSSLAPASTSKPTILVVEDHPGLQEYLATILSEKYHVVTAENGKVALRKIASPDGTPDLILSDLMMPVMDGYQLLEKLKSGDATRHIPVIMLTARADSTDRLKALRIGVDDYLTKPFDEQELLVRIANLLKNQAARRQETQAEIQETDTRLHLSKADRAWLEKFETYIRENLASDILDIPSLSETFAMSDSTLLRQLKRLTGLSPKQYLQEVRLNEARLVLESGTSVAITTLAAQVGYKDARSFSRSFKRRFGKSPSDFS